MGWGFGVEVEATSSRPGSEDNEFGLENTGFLVCGALFGGQFKKLWSGQQKKK